MHYVLAIISCCWQSLYRWNLNRSIHLCCNIIVLLNQRNNDGTLHHMVRLGRICHLVTNISDLWYPARVMISLRWLYIQLNYLLLYRGCLADLLISHSNLNMWLKPIQTIPPMAYLKWISFQLWWLHLRSSILCYRSANGTHFNPRIFFEFFHFHGSYQQTSSR